MSREVTDRFGIDTGPMAEWRTRKTITQDEMLFIPHLHSEPMAGYRPASNSGVEPQPDESLFKQDDI